MTFHPARKIEGARGYILLPVAVALVLVATIAFMSNRESGMGINLSASELEATQASYVAQAGLQHALWHTAQQGCGPYTDLINVAFGKDDYSTSLTTGLGATSSYTVAPDQDAWIGSFQPLTNHGTDTSLHISKLGGDSEIAVLRYDLSSVPADASILSAKAWFHVQTAHPEGSVELHALSANWTEPGATWDTLNPAIDPPVVATIPPQPTGGVWVSVNLTPQVQAWINGQPNHGLALVAGVEGIDAVYLARDTANPPYLEVMVGTPPASPAALKSVGKTGDGTTSTLIRDTLTLYQQPPGFLGLQPDATDGLDTYVYEWKSTWNYGVAEELLVSNRFAYSAANGLLKFNLSGLPRGARIQNARLSLYQNSPSIIGGEIGIHRVARDWEEGDKSGAAGTGATWFAANSTENWTTPGGDIDPAPLSTQTVAMGVAGFYEWDVTALVQGWASGQFDNHGLALVPAVPATEAYFSSSDSTTPEQRPSLEVSYTCVCGETCLAPQGSGGRIILIGNWVGTSPDPRDLEKEAVFESWGYQVDHKDDNFIGEINFADYDAVYVSNTVSPGAVVGQLSWRSIGIVNEHSDLNNDMGFASASSATTGRSLDIVDNSHYITLPFAAGSLPIYSADMELVHVTGTLAGGMQTLATVTGAESLIAIDTGATTINGAAPGRRVALPLGSSSNFTWDYLNNNGRLLVQRALDWSTGANIGGMGNILLVSGGSMIFNITTGQMMVVPTAQEQLRIDLMESWGYTVNLIGDADSQANFDAAIASNDVVYIPQDITSSNLGIKLAHAPIGVVNEEGEQVDELGFSGDKIFKTLREIDIHDNTHYITQPFAMGLLAFSQVDQSVHMLSGQIAPGLNTLGQSFNVGTLWNPSLATLELGQEVSGGGLAAGRRVQLPWGGGTFDIAQLTDDGRTLMRRAIEWGAGAVTAGSPSDMLFVVSDPAVLAATDAAKKTLFESWGYTVNLIDDDALVADFYAASLANGVVYVSATAVPESVGSKLYKVAPGVVNGNTGLHDDFGFSTVRYTSVTNAPLDTVKGHYITQPFDGGLVTLYTSDQSSGGAVGTLAAGLDPVGTWSSGVLSPLAGLVTLEAGATNSLAEETAGRRAQMPWDNLDVGTLSADGLTILQRSLEWAAGANIDLGPVAHWKLDETSGTVAVDSEGGHDGTVSGATWTPGQDLGALQFDGIDDYVDLTSDAELDDVFVGGATVMAWINPAGWGEAGYGRIFDKSSSASSTGDGWVLRLNADNGGLNFGQGFTGARGWWRAALGEITLDTWQHVTVVYDSGSVSNDPLIYLNGVPLTVSEVETPSGDLRSDAAIKLTLGNFAGGTTNTFDGTIDDARIYDRVLDESEIAAIAAAGGGGPVTGPSCDGTYRDEFNARSWDGSNGTLDWSLTPWVELGESDGVTKGDVQVKKDVSDFQLQIQDNDNGGEGVERAVDLSGAGTATLSLEYRRKDLDDSGDYVAVYASSTGMAGPWTELPAPRIEGGGTDGSYQSYSRDISAFISADTAIRLRSSPDNGGKDIVFFDNIQVQCAP